MAFLKKGTHYHDLANTILILLVTSTVGAAGAVTHLCHLYGGGVDIKLLENGKRFLKELVADGDISDVWSVVVV